MLEATTTELNGRSIIGRQRGTETGRTFRALAPATGEELDPPFHCCTGEEVDLAAKLANEAFQSFSHTTAADKSRFLRTIAENIERLGSDLVERAAQETALPEARIRTETQRTCNQLRLFAQMVEADSWVNARIDRGDPDRKPVAKPDVRSLLRPLGPVVVFCASNFPLAFSVAGGDTASALATGNPVIVKAHHAHPGTAELVGTAIADAALTCGMPEGVFSLLYGPGSDVGMQLINHSLIKAGAFTGSRGGGTALMRAAANRPEPIPIYAEMSSVNPVFILPSALRTRGVAIAEGLHASVTLGAGQFCTKPGLVFIPDGEAEDLVNRLSELMRNTPGFTLLTPGISAAYSKGTRSLREHETVDSTVWTDQGNEGGQTGAALFQTTAQSFLTDGSLSAEVFGPATLLIRYSTEADLQQIAESLEGQLTATIHGEASDLEQFAGLISILERKAGRLILNGFPTGVEVGHAIIHGGPFPATSDGRATSVGTNAAFRFVRSICYQDFADAALPKELQNANPLKIWRMIDGELTKEPL